MWDWPIGVMPSCAEDADPPPQLVWRNEDSMSSSESLDGSEEDDADSSSSSSTTSDSALDTSGSFSASPRVEERIEADIEKRVRAETMNVESATRLQQIAKATQVEAQRIHHQVAQLKERTTRAAGGHPSMIVAVTGCSGRIGQGVACALVHAGHTVRGIDLAPPPQDAWCSAVEWHQIDLQLDTADGQLLQAFAGVM